MAHRPPEELKSVADRLASVLAEPAGARTLGLMQQLGILESATPAEPAAPPASADTIGIWQRQAADNGTRWVRVEGGDAWWPWADVEAIEPKGKRPRVLFFGESVARGYFYDPYFNPATALGQLMTRAGGDVEIVDLARTDQMRARLLPLMRSSTALEPDAVVIFAGNNWFSYEGMAAHETLALAALLCQPGGVRAVRHELEQRLNRLATEFLDETARIFAGIPVVITVPEFNLRDWQADLERPPPILEGDANARWLATRRELLALRGRDPKQAKRLAQAMVEIDGGSCAASAALLAEHHLRDGEIDEARRLLELARDADVWMPLPTTPRCFSITQAALRRESARHGFGLVDLPRVFAEQRAGELPDHTLFHDYCHLTIEGMQLAMSAIAERLMPSLFEREAPRAELAAHRFDLPPEIPGRAHLLAAMHNSTWGQPAEVVRHHCAAAVRSHDKVAGTMIAVADMTSRRIPSAMCKSFDTLVQSGDMSSARFLLAFFPLLRKNLVDAVVELTAGSDPELGARIQQARADSHALSAQPTSLLLPWYARSSIDQTDHMLEGGAFYRASSDTSRFSFVLREPADFELTLTYRTPAADGGAELRVNGTAIGTLAAASGWTRQVLRVPASATHGDVNELTITWPISRTPSEALLARAALALELGMKPNVYAIRGELHELGARLL